MKIRNWLLRLWIIQQSVAWSDSFWRKRKTGFLAFLPTLAKTSYIVSFEPLRKSLKNDVFVLVSWFYLKNDRYFPFRRRSLILSINTMFTHCWQMTGWHRKRKLLPAHVRFPWQQKQLHRLAVVRHNTNYLALSRILFCHGVWRTAP